MGVKRIPIRRVNKWFPHKVGENRTFEANLVSFQAFHGLFEKSLARGGDTRDVVLLPLNGGIDMLKYFLDGICDLLADTISRDECNLSRQHQINGPIHGPNIGVLYRPHRIWSMALWL
jgi:hypothetical protein